MFKVELQNPVRLSPQRGVHGPHVLQPVDRHVRDDQLVEPTERLEGQDPAARANRLLGCSGCATLMFIVMI